MKHLSYIWVKLEREICRKNIFLFLDYDGTLTQIVDSPRKAVLSISVKKVLRALARVPRIQLAIVTGRSMCDIKKLVGIKKMIYVANHGLEIEAPGLKFVSPASNSLKKIVKNMSEELNDKLSGIQGIVVENKGLTLSIHYRLAASTDLMKIRDVLRINVEPYLLRKKLKIDEGKQVLEVKPLVEWNKGDAVLWLLEKYEGKIGWKDAWPIYIGDDTTDEDAFRAIKGKGLTVFVGKLMKSHARCFLRDHNEVEEFLKRILEKYKGRINKGKGPAAIV